MLESSLDRHYEPLAVVRRTKSGATVRVRDRSSGATRILEQRTAGVTLTDEQLSHAQRALGLDHPGIVRTHKVDRLKGGYYWLRDDVGEATLRSALDAGIELQVPVAVELISQALDALEALHTADLWIGNLSPSDLFLVPGPGAARLLLGDVGLAHGLVPDAVSAATSVFVGQLRYASPEQFDELADIGPASDIYAIGLIAYEILTGSHPIAGTTTSALIAGHLFRPPIDFDQVDTEQRIPEALRAWVLARLAKTPADRGDAASARLALDALFRSPEPSDSTAQGWSALEELIEQTSQPPSIPTTRPLPPLPTFDSTSGPAPTPPVVTDGPTAMIRQVRSAVAAEASARDEQQQARRQDRLDQAEALLQQARHLAENENFEGSRECLDEVLQIAPDHPEALTLSASVDACLKIQVEESRGHTHLNTAATSLQELIHRDAMEGAEQNPASAQHNFGDQSELTTLQFDTTQARVEADVGSTIQLSPSDLQSALSAAAPASSPLTAQPPLESPPELPAEPPAPDHEREVTEQAGTVTMAEDALEAAKARALARYSSEEVTMPSGFPTLKGPSPAGSPAGTSPDSVLDAIRDSAPVPTQADLPESSPGPGAGSVTLPMAAIEAAKARAIELYNQQQAAAGTDDSSAAASSAAASSTASSSTAPSDLPAAETSDIPGHHQVTDVRPPGPGSVTLPMATIEAAKARAIALHHAERTPTPATWSFTPEPAVPHPPAPQTLPVQDSELPVPPPVERSAMSISDLGFGSDDTTEPAIAQPPSGRRHSNRAEPPESNIKRPLFILAILLGFAAVFAVSYLMSGRFDADLGHGSDQDSAADHIQLDQAEDVVATELPPGAVTVDVSPWAEIVSVVNSSGEDAVIVGARYTPKALTLAPGTYTLTLLHPPSGQQTTTTVEVESRGSHQIHLALTPSVNQFFDQASW